MPKIHIVKSWPDSFQAINRGEQTADIRLLDRGYTVGDFLILREYWAGGHRYSDNWIGCAITHLEMKAEGLAPGYGLLSLAVVVQGDRFDITEFFIGPELTLQAKMAGN